MEKRPGFKIVCPEEVAYRLGYIGSGELATLAGRVGLGPYGDYLHRLLV